ncbi:MAG: hypothetical protein P857_847 [Candidatus Xenolissoclinum pacificiensis L6]|uniref:S-adenosylmethionine uptake transporter n=1 Tax=Candidatus Xenolissoclinum pacificiensis L6 TaxID=1401685 RepID=W2V201_9RICK|nr:MAG: hypothetical protein P857_847 [Candidatus Xenolissoclinum pacificiensis L6]
MKFHDTILVLLVVFCWSTGYLAQSYLVKFVPPFFAMFLESAIVSIVYSPILLYKKPPANLSFLMVLGFLWGPGTYGSMLLAVSLGINVSVVSVIGKTNVIFAIIFARIFFNEKMNFATILGILTSFTGLLFLLNTVHIFSNLPSLFSLMVFAVSWASYNMFVKKLSNMKKNQDEPLNMSVLVPWVSVCAMPQLFCISYCFEDWNIDIYSIPIHFIFVLAYQSLVVTCIVLSIWFRLITKYPMYKVGPFALLLPVFGMISGIVLLREQVTTLQLISSIIMISGLVIVSVQKINQYIQNVYTTRSLSIRQ